MKTYLVGGAVRDQFLGCEVKERDWVVVGATFQDMLAKNYQKVGKDFPVFLHPETKEEYALARTEKKTGVGYYGFICDFNPLVSLDEDLERRDLTINAMALDSNGNLIDPYGGKKDLENKILRHVSSAFVEDPLRVLRVARFAARFYSLGFRVAAETLSLMNKMVLLGELKYLVKERVWQEWSKSLSTKNPEIFFVTLRSCGALKVLLPEIDVLFGMPSSLQYHLEVDTGVHTLMVLSQAAKLSDEEEIRFAATLHDLGKAKTLMRNWPRQIGHEELGVDVVIQLCKRIGVPDRFLKLATMAAKLHLKIHKIRELSAEKIVETLELADVFRRPLLFEKLLLVCEADYLGRGLHGEYPQIDWYFPNSDVGSDKGIKDNYQQANYWRQTLDACNKINVESIISAGFSGLQIKYELRRLRVASVEKLQKTWNLNER